MAAFDVEREYARRTLDSQTKELGKRYVSAVKSFKDPVQDPRQFIEPNAKDVQT